ncbi:MAG: DUF370 domain-containing protein [Dissulfuribacterales bacterium]
MAKNRTLNIGFGNVVVAERIVAIVNPASSPMKRLREEAKNLGKLIDATEGRKTRSILVLDSDHIVLSALQTETIAQRMTQEAAARLEEVVQGRRQEDIGHDK